MARDSWPSWDAGAQRGPEDDRSCPKGPVTGFDRARAFQPAFLRSEAPGDGGLTATTHSDDAWRRASRRGHGPRLGPVGQRPSGLRVCAHAVTCRAIPGGERAADLLA